MVTVRGCVDRIEDRFAFNDLFRGVNAPCQQQCLVDALLVEVGDQSGIVPSVPEYVLMRVDYACWR